MSLVTNGSAPQRITRSLCFNTISQLLPGAFGIHRIGLVCKRIAARPHNRRPGIARTDDIRQDAADSRRRIRIDSLNETAAQVKETLLQINGGIDLARRHPTV